MGENDYAILGPRKQSILGDVHNIALGLPSARIVTHVMNQQRRRCMEYFP